MNNEKFKLMIECATKEWESYYNKWVQKENKDPNEEFPNLNVYIIYYIDFFIFLDKNNLTQEDFNKFHRKINEKINNYSKVRKYIDEIF